MVMLNAPYVPCLGICFGMQLLAVAYGGHVERMEQQREGTHRTIPTEKSPLFESNTFDAYYHHQDEVTKIPPDFVATATSNGIITAMQCIPKMRFGVQFHPECSQGEAHKVLTNFLSVAHRMVIHVDESVSTTRMELLVIANSVNSVGARRTAEKYKMPIESIMRIWNIFRREFGIPSKMV